MAAGESALAAEIAPPVDLAARVVYFPVRHHSPACAWHVERLVRELRPDVVLIEGPRDFTPLLPLLLHAETRMPVAFYTTYVQRLEDGLPARHAAFYPLCDYSPELAALRGASALGTPCKFIDLTFPEMCAARQQALPRAAASLQEEAAYSHSRLLQAACRRTRTRDADDLWDHLFEVDFRELPAERFMRNVYAYCALARRDAAPEQLAADGTLAREQAMAAAIAHETGRVLVVTGGFHSVVLPNSAPHMPKPVKVARADDAIVVLMRYGFEQLDRLNGYASGMPSPEFYQHVWEERAPERLLAAIARACRKQGMLVSTSDVVGALAHVRRLAALREHPLPSREDVLDGVRSLFVKGAADAEGLPVLALARRFLAGDRRGAVPAAAGLPPIVVDFHSACARLKIDLSRSDAKVLRLDLYRRRNHREISRLLHRLRRLGVPFAQLIAGPDFVHGKQLERIQESWQYRWSPAAEAALIEKSLYGPTLADAATALLREQMETVLQEGSGRRAETAALLVLTACQMGLTQFAQELLRSTAGLLHADRDFASLAGAMENLLVLKVSLEPLEAHRLVGIDDLALTAYRQACYVIPDLAATPEDAEKTTLDALNAWFLAIATLGDAPDRQELRWGQLAALAAAPEGNAALHGAAHGLLFAEGRLPQELLVQRFAARLRSPRGAGAEGPNFLRGLLATARSILWQCRDLLAALHHALRDWDEAEFVHALPLLRLALADLTPRECDRVAREVAALTGAATFAAPRLGDASELDLLRGVEVQRRLRASLDDDGLLESLEE